MHWIIEAPIYRLAFIYYKGALALYCLCLIQCFSQLHSTYTRKLPFLWYQRWLFVAIPSTNIVKFPGECTKKTILNNTLVGLISSKSSFQKPFGTRIIVRHGKHYASPVHCHSSPWGGCIPLNLHRCASSNYLPQSQYYPGGSLHKDLLMGSKRETPFSP